MASKILNESVTSPDDGATWDFQCPGIVGSKCGETGPDGRPFHSDGWPTKKTALARGQEHLDEHKAGPAIAQLRDEVRMAADNAPGYEDVHPDDKQAELDELLTAATTSSLDDFRAKHGLGVNPDTGLAVKLEDL